jgi:tetratricopeptide (TPR) repeat protein
MRDINKTRIWPASEASGKAILVAASICFSSPAFSDTENDCRRSDDRQLAIESCSILIQRNPNRAELYYFRSLKYGYKDDSELALKDAHRSLELDKNAGEPLFRIGSMYFATKKYDLAAVNLEKAIQIGFKKSNKYRTETNHDDHIRGFSIMFLSGSYMHLAKLDDALRVINLAVGLGPSWYPWMNRMRARIFERQGKKAAAISELERALKLEPENADVLKDLNRLKRQQ